MYKPIKRVRIEKKEKRKRKKKVSGGLNKEREVESGRLVKLLLASSTAVCQARGGETIRSSGACDTRVRSHVPSSRYLTVHVQY